MRTASRASNSKVTPNRTWRPFPPENPHLPRGAIGALRDPASYALAPFPAALYSPRLMDPNSPCKTAPRSAHIAAWLVQAAGGAGKTRSPELKAEEVPPMSP